MNKYELGTEHLRNLEENERYSIHVSGTKMCIRYIPSADPVRMGRKSCQYTLFQYSVQARLSVQTDCISCMYLAHYPRPPFCGLIYIQLIHLWGQFLMQIVATHSFSPASQYINSSWKFHRSHVLPSTKTSQRQVSRLMVHQYILETG